MLYYVQNDIHAQRNCISGRDNKSKMRSLNNGEKCENKLFIYCEVQLSPIHEDRSADTFADFECVVMSWKEK